MALSSQGGEEVTVTVKEVEGAAVPVAVLLTVPPPPPPPPSPLPLLAEPVGDMEAKPSKEADTVGLWQGEGARVPESVEEGEAVAVTVGAT